MGYVASGTGQAEKVSDLVIVRTRQPLAFRMVDPWSGALVGSVCYIYSINTA